MTGDSKPWYRDGLSFACQQCGGCCSGAPGYVWVSDDDVALMAKDLGISEKEFRARFTRAALGKVSLRERPGGDCVLLDKDSRGCAVYDHRPIQCRTWPWWPENLGCPEDWKACRDDCPGIDQGPLVSADRIERELQKDELVEEGLEEDSDA